MYPINSASPQRLAIGAVVLIADGTVQTSGVSVKVKPQGGAASAGGGTISYEEGIVEYVPTQAETNYTSFEVIAYKTGCIPVAITVVTTASATAGTVLLAPTTHTSAVIPTVSTLTGHTPQTGDSFARLGAPAGASVSADVAAVKTETAAILVDTAEIGAAGAGLTALASAANLATVAGYLDTEIASIISTLGVAGAGLTAVPWNAAWDAEVQSEVADGLTAFWTSPATLVDLVWDEAIAGHAGAGSTGEALAGATAPTAAAVADAVWDEAISGHLTAGSAGEALNAAGAAGDPWTTTLPGAYGVGSAGYIIGTNINATISSRATQTSVDTIDGIVDSILADTNELQTDWANGGRLDLILDARAAQTTVDAIEVDTQDIQSRIPAALASGNMKVDVLAINGSTASAANIARSTQAIALGTVGAASTTTSIVTSSLDPAASVADQFKGRVVTFDRATTTAALRGQATDITASTSGGVLTVTALTTAPVSGDTFSVT